MSRSRTRISLLSLAISLALVDAAQAIPPDQPPMEGSVVTPNVPYYVNGGVKGTYNYFSVGQLLGAGRALDRTGTSGPGNPLGYHAGYAARGFRAPYFSSGSNGVVFWGCGNNPNPNGYDCDNGKAPLDQIVMPADVYRNKSEGCVRVVLGHELFHHIEFGYVLDGGGGDKGCGAVGSAACEGHARAMQDKIYFDADLDPAVSCVASFRGQANGYLDAPDVTIWKASYDSALFWTYLMEQYGEYAFEPGRGTDYLANWWDLAQATINDFSLYDVTEDAIQITKPEHTVLGAFHDFIIANHMKSLTLDQTSASFRNRYSYRDDEVVPLYNNQNQMKSAKITDVEYVFDDGVTKTFNVSAKKFGARYYNFHTTSCPAGHILKFDASPGVLVSNGPNAQLISPDGIFALVTENISPDNKTRPGTLYKYRAKGWHQDIVQPADSYNSVTAIVSGWHTDFAGTISMRCAAPPLAPQLALASTAHPATGLTRGYIDLLGRPIDAAGATLPAIPTEEFSIEIGGTVVKPLAAMRDGDAYRTFLELPSVGSATADLTLHVAGRSTTIPNGFRVAAHAPEVIVAIDTSSSMGTPSGSTRLDAVKLAARAFSAELPPTARLALMRFAGATGTSSDAVLLTPLAPLIPAQRVSFDASLAGIVPSAQAKVGAGQLILTSAGTYDAQGSGGERHLVVFTDSGESATFDAAGFIASAKSAGIRVHVIAVGPSADQPLLARLGRETGGGYDYIDDLATGGGGPVPLLLPAVQAARQAAARMSTAAQGSATTTGGATTEVLMDVDPGLDPAGLSHVKVFSGVSLSGPGFSDVHLFRPDGSEATPGPDVDVAITANRFTFTVGGANGGIWKLVNSNGGAGGPTTFAWTASVVDPTRLLRMGFSRPSGETAALDHFRRGEPVAVEVAALGVQPTRVGLTKIGAGVLQIAMHDDGSHGDRHADDGIWTAIVAANTQGSPTGFEDNGAASGALGSLELEATATYSRTVVANGATLQVQGGFAVLDDGAADGDGDGLPTRYETRHPCLSSTTSDASADSDGDGATNAAELAAGSDPCDVDSDDGGETDGSEIAHAASPLDPTDDALPRIRHAEILRQRSEHMDAPTLPALANVIRFDTVTGFYQTFLRRAPTPTGVFVPLATIDATTAHGSYTDANLVDGQNYCYQLVPATIDGRIGAASDTICAVAHADNTAPTGSILVNEGAPRTVRDLLIFNLALYDEDPATTQMKLVLPDGSTTGWLQYASTFSFNAAALPKPSVATAKVIYRDASGNESFGFVDDIDLVATSAYGRIPGKVNVNTAYAPPGTPIAGCTITPDAAAEPAATSIANGDFALEDLPPGTYTLTVECTGYQTRTLTASVAGGGSTDLGVVAMTPSVLFSDGFE